MTDLILVGIQGSGKGTQGKILAEQFGYKIFETGGELRAIAKEDSDLGRKVKEITEFQSLSIHSVRIDFDNGNFDNLYNPDIISHVKDKS